MKIGKSKKTIGIVLSVILVIITLVYTVDLTKNDEDIHLGVTFSKVQAENFGLDWKEVYQSLLEDLNIKNFRLIAYWDEIEKEEGKYDFSDLTYQLSEAKKHGADVVLTIGHRVPRWPECFAPDWVDHLSKEEFNKKLLNYLETLVKRFRQNENISHWQLENEPYLRVFGLCPKPDVDLYTAELALLKKLDSRPVITTDSGELSLWNKAGKHGDVFGTSMYIKVWNKHLGFFEWVLPAVYYPAKFNIFVGEKPFYLMELQAEPWGSQDRFLSDIPIDEQLRVFNEKHLQNYTRYAKKSGFDRIYLWGAEWWYWLKKQEHPELWETAKNIFK